MGRPQMNAILDAVAAEFGVPAHRLLTGRGGKNLRRDPSHVAARAAVALVARHMMGGGSIREVAEECGITWQAARYRLDTGECAMVDDPAFRRRVHAATAAVWREVAA